MARGPADPVKLRTILQHLRREPRPILPAVKYLKLNYAIRNDHFGARHFAKEELPRIAYSNPGIKVTLNKFVKKPDEQIAPVMEVTLQDGSQQVINMDKQSDMILQGLMDVNDMAMRKATHLREKVDVISKA